MATAVKLAARKRRGIHVLAMVTVVINALPSTRRCPKKKSGGRLAGDRAGAHPGRPARVDDQEKIRAGQAGRRIIEEATDMRAAAIVMPLPRRVAGALAVRQDARDGVDRAPVPGDHQRCPTAR